MKFHLRALWGEVDSGGSVNYWLEDFSGKKVYFNEFVGKKITIRDTGERRCRICDRAVEEVYQKGACSKCFKTSPRCDICMIKPELCHFDRGTCRDDKFAKKWCFNNQLIYFSLTSEPKVGYLSMENYPQRWIDQGATQAIVVAKARSRLEAGEIETYLAQFMKDKTNWSAMLRGATLESADLSQMKKQWAAQIEKRWPGRLTEGYDILKFIYPVQTYPKKVSSVGFGNSGMVGGVLKGIRGQYLIIGDKVFSIKKHEGYIVDINIEEASFIELAEQGSLF